MNTTAHSDGHRWDRASLHYKERRTLSAYLKDFGLGETATINMRLYSISSYLCGLVRCTVVYESLTDMLSMALGRFWSPPPPCFFFLFPPASCCFFAFLDIS